MLKRRTGIDARDILAAAGFVCWVYGLACWWPPAAWIGSGILLMALAVWSDLTRRAS